MGKDIHSMAKNQIMLRIRPYILLALLIAANVISLIMLAVGIKWAYYLLLLFIGFGFNRLFFLDKYSIIRNLMLGWFTSSAILIVFCAFLDLVTIPINQLTINLFVLSSLVLFSINYKRYKTNENDLVLDKFDLLVIIFSVMGLFAKVYSIRTFYAPILHDPMSHAEWAKQIAVTGKIHYFYSPGLHILAAVGEILHGFDSAKQILLLTNIYNALIGLPVYVFLRVTLNKKWWGIIAASLFIFGYYPTYLFTTAGKNALIVAISLIFMTLIVLVKNGETNWKKILLSNIFVLALLLTHYPAGFIGSVIIGSYFLVNLKEIKNILWITPAFFIAAFWGIEKYILYKVKDLNPFFSVGQQKSIVFSWKYCQDFFLSTWNQSLSYINKGFLGDVILVLGVIGILLVIISSHRENTSRWALISLIFYVLAMFLFGAFNLPQVRIIYSSQIILSFVFFYLSSSFIVGELIIPYFSEKSQYFQLIAIIMIVIFSASNTFSIFDLYKNQQTKKNMVNIGDLRVYNWINLNMSKDVIILNNGIMGSRQGIVFPTDAGAWITAYTTRKIALPFSEFSTRNTYDNYLLQQELFENPGNCETIKNLQSRGINYYFIGSASIFGSSIIINKSYETENIYKLIFQSKGAKLYQIMGCKN